MHACVRIKGQGGRVRVHLDRPDPERERKFNDFGVSEWKSGSAGGSRSPRFVARDDVKRIYTEPLSLELLREIRPATERNERTKQKFDAWILIFRGYLPRSN